MEKSTTSKQFLTKKEANDWWIDYQANIKVGIVKTKKQNEQITFIEGYRAFLDNEKKKT